MNYLRQIVAVTELGIRSLWERVGPASVVIISIASVVAVLLSVLAMARGFANVLSDTGRQDRAIVLLKGSISEAASGLSRDTAQIIANTRGVKRIGDVSVSAPEVLVFVGVRRKSGEGLVQQTLRGIPPVASQVRPELRIVEGRWFTPGLPEVIVGKSAFSQFAGLEIGSHVMVRDTSFAVVGLFESSGDAHESELMTDASTLMSAYSQSFFQSVTALLESSESFQLFKDALTSDPSLNVEVFREREYYDQQSGMLKQIMFFVAYIVGALMAIGAMAGAVNTMFAVVSARATEIATLRAIGFNAGGIIFSVLFEALLLAMLGAMIGVAMAWVFFNGTTLSTFGGTAQVVFSIRIAPDLAILGVVWALGIGFIGGLVPAIRAARMPVVDVLRGV